MYYVIYWGLGADGTGKWFTALETPSAIAATRREAKLSKKGYIAKTVRTLPIQR